MNKKYKKFLKIKKIKTKSKKKMEHVRYHPSIAKYTYRIEYLEKLPSKKNYADAKECAMAGLQYGHARFGNNLINVRVLKDGQVVESWQQ